MILINHQNMQMRHGLLRRDVKCRVKLRVESNLDECFASRFSGELWERVDSVVSVLTEVNLQR